MPLPTCTHIHDTGRTCNSVAAKDQKYCSYHLHYRGRQLRLAQLRARAERFDIKLPPLQDMYSVQSALSQLAEALAADMIDLKRAHALMSVLRLMAQNFRHADKWQTDLYRSDQPAAVNVAQEYGLPHDLDLDTPPALAFPLQANKLSASVILSEGGRGAPPLSPEFGDRVGIQTDNRQPATANFNFRPDFPVDPMWLELRDIENTQGAEARALRFTQLERNRARRHLRINRKRYVDLALRLNIRSAAEHLAALKVAEKLKEAGIAPAQPEKQDFDTTVAEDMKRMRACNAEIDACLAGQEVKIA